MMNVITRRAERWYINHDSTAIKIFLLILSAPSCLVFNSLTRCHKFCSMRNLLRRMKKRERRQEPQKSLSHEKRIWLQGMKTCWFYFFKVWNFYRGKNFVLPRFKKFRKLVYGTKNPRAPFELFWTHLIP